jgi:transketolase
LAKKDKDIILLVGDLGYNFVEPFKRRFPKRFINCGIIEQSMVGIACGLALTGKKPYVYSGTNFLLFRAYEQIRNDMCYNNVNVKLIGTSASQFLGFTHHLEGKENYFDIIKNLPNVHMYFPKDEKEVIKSTTDSYKNNKPSFIFLK